MTLPQRYQAADHEAHWQTQWAREGVYEYAPDDPRPTFAIDTPPPTVSGELTIGHVYSYIQAEALIRFWRMQGYNVYYPFGFDDNGLPTERFVERQRGIRARDVGRAAFIAACLDVSREVEDRFETFWKSLGMSVDWRLRYSTIDPQSRRISQWSFLDLYRKGRMYQAQAPNPWCVECQTAIAQAEIDDAERETTFYTLAFRTRDLGAGAMGQESDASPSLIPIATTRPELLPACVAVFVHPDDARYAALVGQQALVPLSGARVPILADAAVDPAKGSGAVMCCTFGDTADVAWWREHQLPLIALVTRQGTLSDDGGPYAGLTLADARRAIVSDLRAGGLLLAEQATPQTVRIHERCKTPLEILETSQWFIRVLDARDELLAAGQRIDWRPEYMRTRYEHWVANLQWDWCISRQRFYGVPFPLWHCNACGGIVLADDAQLPVDPTVDGPPRACACGSADLRPELDVMDTWATSSCTPLIALLRIQVLPGQRLEGMPIAETIARFGQPCLPMQLRPQAHDIIRTWAFYTIVKTLFHFGTIPWETAAISGHALAPDGTSIHKSLGNSPVAPQTLIERYGADALRYWVCNSGLGSDQSVNEDDMRQGMRLSAKLWSAARFIAGHLEAGGLERWRLDAQQQMPNAAFDQLTPTDRALLSWLQRTIETCTAHFKRYEYALALQAAERFFWVTLCDNYLEWAKARLYDGEPHEQEAARATLATALSATLKLFAPFLPHVTEAIYQAVFRSGAEQFESLHTSAWPALPFAVDEAAERAGAAFVAIGTAVRRFKSERRLGLGTPLQSLVLAVADAELQAALAQCDMDLRSLTRAAAVTFNPAADGDDGAEQLADGLALAITT